jgi:hypothetical protein
MPSQLTNIEAVENIGRYWIARRNDGSMVAWGEDRFQLFPNLEKLLGVVIFQAIDTYAIAIQLDPFSKKLNRFVTVEEMVAEKQAAAKAAAEAAINEKTVREKMLAENATRIAQLIREADSAAAAESRKSFWQRKDYAHSEELYGKAIMLGSAEAREKLGKLSPNISLESLPKSAPESHMPRQCIDAANALIALGYNKRDADKQIEKAFLKLGASARVEALIRTALRM